MTEQEKTELRQQVAELHYPLKDDPDLNHESFNALQEKLQAAFKEGWKARERSGDLHPDMTLSNEMDLVEEAEHLMDRLPFCTTWEVMQMLEHIKARAVNQATKISDN